LGRRAFILALLAGAACTACATRADRARDVVIVARGMTFVTPENPGTANPLLTFRAGERIRLVLRNEAPGLLHDFAIPAWNVEIGEIQAGESRDVVFTVPDAPGRFEYRCRPHSAMMNGPVDVTR
jgi:plastocyanin